ncbi:hypothetical protein KFE25_006712 [Diacronema lutheri]|uniref:Uncharacterized protein n=2 Tax=Diacronema lutheri TaxID=2081491 RepID=A0A8J6CF58_DIALT|nr:hypothetical protein KFE25_006712 [Diacronema lutheri]
MADRVGALLNASKENDVPSIRRLLEANASPDAANVINQSALHIASLWGSMDAVRLLVGAGASVNAANRFGATPLHCAAQRGQAEVGRFLVQHGANTATVAGNGLAPYEMCADPLLWSAFGSPRTELHAAAAAPDPVPALEAVLASADASVDSIDERGDTALAIAARRCHVPACMLLLELGANMDVLNRDGLAPLHGVVALPLLPLDAPVGTPTRAQIGATVRLLLDKRADPNCFTQAKGVYSSGSWERREADGSKSVVSSAGVSCLHLAVEASADAPDVVELLLDAGAQLDARSGGALATPLHVAIDLGFMAIAAMLLARGADPDAGNRDIGADNSLLHSAAQSADMPLARLLLDAHADVNKCGKGGLRPLHMAARSSTAAFVQLLLDAGADASATDARGKAPADYAAANPRQAPVLELLRAACSGPAPA